MSLISTIKAKALSDLLNGGSKVIYTGTVGAVTDQVIQALPNERMLYVSSIVVSCDNATPRLVSLGFKKGADPTIVFFSGYVSSGGSITKAMVPEDWVASDLSLATTGLVSLVITATGGNVAYTIQGKIFAEKEPLGYIEQIGVQTHNNPTFGWQSGAARGQSEF